MMLRSAALRGVNLPPEAQKSLDASSPPALSDALQHHYYRVTRRGRPKTQGGGAGSERGIRLLTRDIYSSVCFASFGFYVKSPKSARRNGPGCATLSAGGCLDASDSEDIVQEVFYELVEANRLPMPIDHVTGWLFRVARNRIADLFRKKKPETFTDVAVEDEKRLKVSFDNRGGAVIAKHKGDMADCRSTLFQVR